jgi:hypothetical protein
MPWQKMPALGSHDVVGRRGQNGRRDYLAESQSGALPKAYPLLGTATMLVVQPHAHGGKASPDSGNTAESPRAVAGSNRLPR